MTKYIIQWIYHPFSHTIGRFNIYPEGLVKDYGLLLINLGTPDHANIKSVRHFLKQFLSDPRVIDLPHLIRSIVVRLILIKRPKISSAAYQKIWTTQGSPLLTHSYNLVKALQLRFGNKMSVAFGMRYGNPSIASALQQLTHCKHIIILPLFPQYSSAATGSAVAHSLELIAQQWNIPQFTVINSFYQSSSYIQASCHIIKQSLPADTFLLFSYHGLPVRHIDKSQCKASCNKQSSCPSVKSNNHYCYRAQCYQTARLLAKELDLNENQYAIAFQSRVGRVPWIKPYTDELLPKLYQQGIRKLAISCPAFVADNLETLEEIGIRARQQWLSLGGEEFTHIPCLNDSPQWMDSIETIIKKQIVI